MQLQVKPHHTNHFPLQGLLIKGHELHHWLKELQRFKVDLQQVSVYAIPGTTANSTWGCFVPLPSNQWTEQPLNANEPCQFLYNALYIPQYATIFPMINAAEAAKLFNGTPYILHPDFGLAALDAPINWSEAILLNPAKAISSKPPIAGAFIPQKIKRLEIKTLPPEEVLKAMEETAFPKKEQFKDEPLSLAEKIKLGLLRTLLKPGKNTSTGKEKSALMKALEKLLPESKLFNQLEQDLEALEKRNRTEMEKLMDLFKKNPEEALKFAIPLDADGTGRGGNLGQFEMSKRWNDFNLFGNSGNYGTGNSMMGLDAYQRLQHQYTATANELIRHKNYEKAAFVYMKLLKNHFMAAKTLEDGKLYPEAASVYLKYVQNKQKAAECYEKGQMHTDAIELYKELKQNEKAGDLYLLQQKKKEAFEQYHFVADEYIEAGKYVKASLLYRHKMNDAAPAQELLLKGWRNNKDAFNCINNYFQHIEEPKLLMQAIEQVYEKDTNDHNKPAFLSALKYEHKKGEDLAERTREMAYEIVADLAPANPEIVAELKNFNTDKSLVKDVARYKTQRREQGNS